MQNKMRCTDARKYGDFAYYFQGYVIQAVKLLEKKAA